MILNRFLVFLVLLTKCIHVNAMQHGVNILSLTNSSSSSSSSSDGDAQYDVAINDDSLWKIITRKAPYHFIPRSESIELVETFSTQYGPISFKGQQAALKKASALSDPFMCQLIKNLDVDPKTWLITIKLPQKKQASYRIVSGEHEQKWKEQRTKIINDSSL